MNYYEVAPTKIVRQGQDSFTYSSLLDLRIGQLVQIEVGKKIMTGLIIKKTAKPKSYSTKDIVSIIDSVVIPEKLISLSLWMSNYYLTPLALVLQTILPSGLNKKRRKSLKDSSLTHTRKRTNFLFNKEQASVIKDLKEQADGTFLLQGITGSGKTAIYIDLVKNAVRSGKSAIVVVPEIALTSQIVAEMSNHFTNIFITHSRMNEAQRHKVWTEILNNKEPSVIVGPRSALFMPVDNLGVIIIDEAHEPSLKQEQSPKYSALRVATILGRLHKIKVIFGSATPNVIDRYLAEKSNNPVLKLTQKAQKTILPEISLVDMKDRKNFSNHRFLSNKLLEVIEESLKKHRQVLIFHNRRGSASITLCTECGWVDQCQNCLIPTVLHTDTHQLKCHVCGSSRSVPTSCPVCKNTSVVHKGIGTKLIEAELIKLFPSANIARFDADNKQPDSLEQRYQDLYDGKIDIIVGTQVIAKGLDLPNLRTVGIIQADAGLSLPDFSVEERTFQLLSQVIGRVGRTNHKAEVVVQTYQPKSEVIQYGLKQDYEAFYKAELKNRQLKHFPPFTHLLKLTCIYKNESSAIRNSKLLANKLKASLDKDVLILGPAPEFYEYKYGSYRWQLVLKSPKREHLLKAVNLLPNNNWQFELDPNDLL